MTDVLTRRQLLERAAAGGVFLTVPGVLAACGGKTKSAGGNSAANRQLAKTLRFSNWTLYIDVDPKTKKRPTLVNFEKRYSVHVKYVEDINDNASYFGKIQGPLSRGQSIDRDLIVLTDNSRFPGLVIKKGWVEKLDRSAIPNIKNLEAALQHPSFDPNRDYSLPWASGITGIGFNDKLTDPVLSIDQLLDDRKLKGKVTMLTEMADSMTPVILANGDDPTNVTDQVFDRAFSRIKKAADSGQIRQFTGNDYSGPLAKGDLAAAVGWSGDFIQLIADNKNLHWNVPEAGTDIWTDNMMIPKGGDVYTASVFMNYIYDPKVAARLYAGIQYICPVIGAKAVLAKTDPKDANNPLIFPTKEMLSKVHVFDTKALNNQKYLEAWQNLISA
ncbi:MAG: spermidine/putrescine ABC transporter substrate-binding protein [Chloroflexota bacterium]|nr:spermidine/putrescine ABC transporter substrate-binding protein [Chloroflexota bacterium]